jgi:hypothetical protein
MTTVAPSTALATIQPAFTDPERLPLFGDGSLFGRDGRDGSAGRAAALMVPAAITAWPLTGGLPSSPILGLQACQRRSGAVARCRTVVMLDVAPGTTCGNHRADFPRHPGASRGMVSAGQAHEAGSVSWALLWAVFALQARGS